MTQAIVVSAWHAWWNFLHQETRNPSLAKGRGLRRIGRSVHLPIAMPQRLLFDSPAAQARHVLALTAKSWRIPPSSPREIARRAPHGYVPVRALRRLHAAAVLALLPHSW
ncbi:hypothetical protein [Variovorax sp. EL159]|uniref:hypothetical protein n=1 Tax=Variovorax sp. EL159 TaxID=1566270 RepID=UPI001C40A3F0|nr:hypothetical protein [Variovorax sp. EL159]